MTLVVDASVAVGAGGSGKLKPACKPCRDFLLTILHDGHRLAWSAPIAAEWKNHAASFARGWRVQMFARRKVSLITPPEIPGLRKRIAGALATAKERAAADKDHHLLLTALESDRTIATLDEAVRTLFARACGAVVEVRAVVWVNPNHAEERPLKWLAEGAPAEQFRTLARFTGR